MGSDFWIVLQWWGTLFLVGAVAFPMTKRLFAGWFDSGYFFSKAVGMAVVTYLVYVLGILHVAPFVISTVFMVMVGVFVLGLLLNRSPKELRLLKWRTIITEEVFFFAALLFWSWIKGHEPSVRGLEKFMDYGFMQSIFNSRYFPAPDMWYQGFPINYYYFGHTVVAVLTKLSGLDLAYTFNLMLSTIFALCLTMSFSIGRQLTKKIGGGILTAWLVTLAGNMQTLYAFTRGYTGEDVKPIWQLLWPIGEFFTKLPEGLQRYWYANATRFIPLTIHEFPSYSFVVSDVHGHVLSIPFALLAIALLIQIFATKDLSAQAGKRQETREYMSLVFYGLLVAILLMTNALDGPIYIGLFITLFFFTKRISWKKVGVVVGAAILTSLPFLWHFKSFVSGLAINCPPAFLADRKIGILLFETVDKCQRSPLWMMYLLWGFFWYCGIFLLLKKKFTQVEKILLVFFFFSIALLIFPEFFYFKDIYPAHFRSNTMFKLGYEAYILFSIVSGFVIVHAIQAKKKIFLLLLIPQLFLVSIYPIFSVRSYFDSLRTYRGLDGLAWIQEQYPDDYKAIMWLRNNVTMLQRANATMPVIVEADGDSYTDYQRFSAFTGLPTIVGWSVHEWLWRGSYDVVAPRKEDVRIIYESSDIVEIRSIVLKYDVAYIIVGTLEREKFPTLVEEKFMQLGTIVFTSGDTRIYAVDNRGK